MCILLLAAEFRNGDIRLVGGTYQWEGRVEIFLDGVWGTIADSHWSGEEAETACRMMGYFIPGKSYMSITIILCYNSVALWCNNVD